MKTRNYYSSVLVLPASSVLTDPGQLCDGQPATVTCTITDGDNLRWIYDADGSMVFRFQLISPRLESFPPTDPVLVPGGDEFTLSLLSPRTPPLGPDLVSQISFEASVRMNGRTLRCDAFTRSGGRVMRDVILEVVSGM